MSRRRLLLVLTSALLAGALFAFAGGALLRGRAGAQGTLVAGGDGGGLPRATPEAEGFDAAALAQAGAQARAMGAGTLLVLRHGHLVHEQYGAGSDAGTLVAGGAMSEALEAIVVGVAVRERGLELPTGRFDAQELARGIAAASGQAYPEYLARSLWQPLNAAPARLVPSAGSSALACCLAARAGDWLRVASLMMEGGRFEGTQIVAAQWLARMGTPLADDPGRGYGLWLAPAARGAEPFAAQRVVFLRGPGSTRLWLMPALDLAVLLVDDAQAAGKAGVAAVLPFDETRVPNLVTRALRAQAVTGGQGLGELVPGH